VANDLGILQESTFEILTCNLCESKGILESPQTSILNQFLELLQVNLTSEYLGLTWVVDLLQFYEIFIFLQLTSLLS
jgi:hypothetical protein